MQSLNPDQRRAFQRMASIAATVLFAALPAAALAQATMAMGSDDPVGKPFALWIFLVPIAGIMAAVTAYAAKAAVEKPSRR